MTTSDDGDASASAATAEVHGAGGDGLPERSAGAPAPGAIVPSHYSWCIGCGTQHPGGLRLEGVAGDGLAMRARIAVTEFHQGAPGLAHGGIISTAMDEAQGMLNVLLGVPAVTARLEVDFRRPVPVGSTLEIDMRITGQRGRRVMTSAEGRLADGNGEVAVRSTAIFVQVPVEHFVTHGEPTLVQRAVEERRRGGPAWGRSRTTEVNP